MTVAGRPYSGPGQGAEAGGDGQPGAGGAERGPEAPDCQQPEEPGHPGGLPSPPHHHCPPANRSPTCLFDVCSLHPCSALLAIDAQQQAAASCCSPLIGSLPRAESAHSCIQVTHIDASFMFNSKVLFLRQPGSQVCLDCADSHLSGLVCAQLHSSEDAFSTSIS